MVITMKKKSPLAILLGLLPHLTISLSLFMITCLIVDYYNGAVSFINNGFTKNTLMVFAILVIVESVVFVLRDRKRRSHRDCDSGKDEK